MVRHRSRVFDMTPRDCPGPDNCAPVRAAVSGGWHVKKEIQIGHLLTTLSMFISAVLFVLAMDKRLLVVETRQESMMAAQIERDERQDKNSTESVTLLRTQLGKIDEKLDRLIERGRPDQNQPRR